MILLDEATISQYYINKFWTKSMVWDAVSKKKITAEQYATITGDTYQVERPSDV